MIADDRLGVLPGAAVVGAGAGVDAMDEDDMGKALPRVSAQTMHRRTPAVVVFEDRCVHGCMGACMGAFTLFGTAGVLTNKVSTKELVMAVQQAACQCQCQPRPSHRQWRAWSRASQGQHPKPA